MAVGTTCPVRAPTSGCASASVIASEPAPGTQLDSLGCTGVAAVRAIQAKETRLTSATWGSSSFKFLQPRLARIGGTQSRGHPSPRGLRPDGTGMSPSPRGGNLHFPSLGGLRNTELGSWGQALRHRGVGGLSSPGSRSPCRGQSRIPSGSKGHSFHFHSPSPLSLLVVVVTPVLCPGPEAQYSIKGKKSLGLACS